MKKISEKYFYTNILPKSYENPDGGGRMDDRPSRRPLLVRSFFLLLLNMNGVRIRIHSETLVFIGLAYLLLCERNIVN